MLRPLRALTRDQRLIYLSSLLWGFGMSLFSFIQPLYIERLGATPAQIGLVLASSGLLVTVIYVPIGMWADRRGRKPVILAGWGLGSVATLAMAFAPDWRWIIPAMAVYQFSNFAVPAMNGYIAAGAHKTGVLRTFAVLSTGSAIGSILSPALGGWIGERAGLRAVYIAAGLTFSLSTLVLAFISHQTALPASSPRGDTRRVLSNRPFLWQIVFAFLLFFALETGQVMVPKFLEDVRHLSVGQIGWLGTIGSLGTVLLSLALAQLRRQRPWELVLGQASAFIAGLLFLFTGALPLIMLAYFVYGSNRLVRPFVSGRLARSLDPSTLSFGYGLYETAMRLGLAAAPYAAGLLYARAPAWPLYAGLAGVGATIVLTFTLPDQRAALPAVAGELAVEVGD